ncbi:bifunctional diguanylate cyclase/phosphodiesterase [Acidovorax lacteus]|uniref:EAL domain-containing protein n=1 Tax=Acidovorax lacteus TaxID=1924988 RepID=A0ABP8L3N2_9BURK
MVLLHALSRPRPSVVGLAVAVLGVVLSVWLMRQQSQAVAMVDRARFEQAAQSFADAMGQSIAANTEVVQGLRSLFTANPDLGRADFDRVARELDIKQRYPGVRNLSFTRHVPGDQRMAYEARVRADTSLHPQGYPDFAIKPAGERHEYFVAEYLWPMEGNESVMGWDISAQPTNLEAMRYSRETGLVVASGPFDLLQEESHRAAFVLRVPVFDRTRDPVSPRFIGAVASTIRVYDLVGALRAQGYLDGIAVSMADLGSLRNADDATQRPLLEQTGSPLPEATAYVREMPVHDRRWQLRFMPTRSFVQPAEQRLPWLAGLAGLVVTLLLSALAMLLTRRGTLALARAQVSDEARRDSEERFRALFHQAAVGVAQVHTSTGRLVRVNQKFGDILGYSPAEMLALEPAQLLPPPLQADEQAQVRRLHAGELQEYRTERCYAHKSGKPVWVDLTLSPMWSASPEPDYHLAVVQDITQRKALEETLRQGEQRLRGILKRLPVGMCLVQADGRMAFRNDRFVQICGYTEADVPTVEEWWVRAYPDPDYRARTQAVWSGYLEKAFKGDGRIEAGEYLVTCKDGKTRSLEIAGVVSGSELLVTLFDLSQRKAAEEEIRYLAFYDPLTRLPNRRLLMDRVHQALAASVRHQRSGALLLLDLDNFKTLNETQGHDRGDQLLLQVAHRLRACVHEDDTVARLGGDEFVVVLEDLGDSPEDAAGQAEELGQRILASLREPYRLEQEVHHSSLSLGITIFSGTRETPDELLKRADLAMYQAKAAGRDTLRFYDPQMQASVSARAAMELDMRAGLAQNQFELYYQPQMEGGRIIGAEALLRWRHPRDGFISPGHFIPLAEETGLILPLGEWVLKAACEQLARWSQDPQLSRLSVSVNVSARQFRQEGFVAQVLAAIAGAGADGRRLKLEMTESLLLEDVEGTIAKMVQLKGYGVGFSLDDFGTGYSSLSYLKRLPLDQLKIDQSFVRDVLTDPNDAAIARTIVALASSLGLRAMAEGVETEAQRDFLARHHCHAWQGFLLSPPVPVAAFEALVRSRAADTVVV